MFHSFEEDPFVGDLKRHEFFMQHALQQAQAADAEDEVPVGAIIVHNHQIIAAAHNQREQLHDPTAHAEMIAITQAAEALGDWRLEKCTLYVTLEPCCMCAGAIVQARIPTVVYGADDPKGGAAESLFTLLNDDRLNHQCDLISGVLKSPCGEILTEFFRRQRRLGKK
ncbi:MAG: tRNA adenosine(34) deaminase TadA [Planctomycetaceae bacterium]|nr:tRNA adenosine(34) deaminase TadA [Planctomycetaceae bacterium]|tara:strand:- start:5732 stop:6235 length:504 start_codon:yes stop_codon:yes gene_type:complete